MSNWSKPSESVDLQELPLQRGPDPKRSSRWYLAAFVLGVGFVCLLGLFTDLFDSGPTETEVSAAYREGLDAGTADAEAFWQEELERIYWDHFEQGQGAGLTVGPVLARAIAAGFSWQGGYDAGLEAPDISLNASYWRGWMLGYDEGYVAVAGVSPTSVEWGGEP